MIEPIYMKKQICFFVLSLLLLVFNSANAQFNKDDKLLNVGIGVNSYYNGGIPLSSSFEVGITDEISVGAGLDYLSHRYNTLGVKYGFSALYLGARGSYHFSKLLNLRDEALDVYGGASLGYRRFTWRDNNNFIGLGSSYGSGLFVGIHVGARYYFAPKVGGFFEVGAGGSGNARLGLAFRL